MRLISLMPAVFAASMLVPPEVHAMSCPNVFRGQLNATGEGRRMWLEFNCYGCHGNSAAGGMGPNIRGAERGDLSEAVLHGDAMEGGMPSFKGCATSADVKNIGAYLHSIGTKNEPTWLDWWNAIP